MKKFLIPLLLITLFSGVLKAQGPPVPYKRSTDKRVLIDVSSWSQYLNNDPHGVTPHISSVVPDSLKDGQRFRDTLNHITYIYNKGTATWETQNDPLFFWRFLTGSGLTIGDPFKLNFSHSPTPLNNFAVFRSDSGDLVLPPINYSQTDNKVTYTPKINANGGLQLGTPSYDGGSDVFLKYNTSTQMVEKDSNLYLPRYLNADFYLHNNGHRLRADSMLFISGNYLAFIAPNVFGFSDATQFAHYQSNRYFFAAKSDTTNKWYQRQFKPDSTYDTGTKPITIAPLERHTGGLQAVRNPSNGKDVLNLDWIKGLPISTGRSYFLAKDSVTGDLKYDTSLYLKNGDIRIQNLSALGNVTAWNQIAINGGTYFTPTTAFIATPLTVQSYVTADQAGGGGFIAKNASTGHAFLTDIRGYSPFSDEVLEWRYKSNLGTTDALLTLDSLGNLRDKDGNQYVTSASGGSAGGDLAGTYPNPTVNQVNGITKSYYDPTSSIQTQLNAKAPLASPTFTGTPAVPTASPGTNTTQAASTAFVAAAVAAGGGGGGGGSPGGTDMYMQYDSVANFSGNNGLLYDYTNKRLGINLAGTAPSTALEMTGSVIIHAGSSGTAGRAWQTFAFSNNFDIGTTTHSVISIGTTGTRDGVIISAIGGAYNTVADGALEVQGHSTSGSDKALIVKDGSLGEIFKITNDGAITTHAPLKLTVYTVSTLPAAGSAGRTAYVSDATAPTYLGTLTGSGTVGTPVVDNGSAWVSY